MTKERLGEELEKRKPEVQGEAPNDTGSQAEVSNDAVTEHKYLNGMITLGKFVELLNAYKRVSKIPADNAEIKKWLVTIDRVNSLDRYETQLDGISIKEFQVPSVFRDLIMPASVTVSGTRAEKDLRKRVKYDFSGGFDSNHGFNVVSSAIASALYKDATKIESIDRTDASLTSVIERVAYNGNVVASLTPFIPVELTVSFFDDIYYNTDADKVFHDALRDRLRDENSK